jgi:hypothetical protein
MWPVEVRDKPFLTDVVILEIHVRIELAAESIEVPAILGNARIPVVIELSRQNPAVNQLSMDCYCLRASGHIFALGALF